LSIDKNERQRGSDEPDAPLLLEVDGAADEADVVFGGEERNQGDHGASGGDQAAGGSSTAYRLEISRSPRPWRCRRGRRCSLGMNQLSLRGLSEAQMANLKQEARRQGISVNRLVLQRIGSAEPGCSAAGEDPLLHLVGTWSQEEADAFATAIAPLEQVDADLWS
jgi:hypothetical protein